MKMRIALIFVVVLAGLTGCAQKKLPAAQLAKLKGGTTKVVVYGFCVPMDHVIKITMTRARLRFIVNGKTVGTMKTCSSATFKVPSGYWSAQFKGSFALFGHYLPKMIYRPGKTQYLYMYPAGNGTYEGEWVSKAQAKKGIAEIKRIGQLF